MIKWNFEMIIKDKQINSDELKNTFYKKLFDSNKNDQFFDEHYLGFAYIKPSNDVNDEEQSKFYSNIFRNINTSGTKLTRLESRKSLYFLKDSLKDFFAPIFFFFFNVVTSSKVSGLIDFIKYLSILSQYKGNDSSLFRYGGRDWEKNENYYQKYIVSIVNNKPNDEFRFDISFPENPYNNVRMENLKKIITELNINKSFEAIIEMDMYFFGLVNEVVFKNKKIDNTKYEELKEELKAEIEQLKNTENHKHNPNALKYLKSRIASSIGIYEKYAK
jgi:hypothetical protein